MMIARIFGIAVQTFMVTQDKNRAFEKFENFIANPEASAGDSEATELLQELFSHKYDEIITLANYRLLNGMILRNTQCIKPVSDLAYYLENSSEEQQVRILGKTFFEFIQTESEYLDTLTISGGSGLFLLGNSRWSV